MWRSWSVDSLSRNSSVKSRRVRDGKCSSLGLISSRDKAASWIATESGSNLLDLPITTIPQYQHVIQTPVFAYDQMSNTFPTIDCMRTGTTCSTRFGSFSTSKSEGHSRSTCFGGSGLSGGTESTGRLLRCQHQYRGQYRFPARFLRCSASRDCATPKRNTRGVENR